jgi:hypothetical protein
MEMKGGLRGRRHGGHVSMESGSQFILSLAANLDKLHLCGPPFHFSPPTEKVYPQTCFLLVSSKRDIDVKCAAKGIHT